MESRRRGIEVKLIYMGKKAFYHLFSDGFRTDVLFKDRHSFIAGMNIVAQTFLGSNIKILAFILMDNHVHFVLYGSMDDCLRFKEKFVHRFAIWYHNQYSGRLLEALEFDIKELDDERYLLNSIAYVLRNGIAAGFAYCPEDYQWSSAGLYFRRPGKLEEMSEHWMRISDLSVRARRNLMHSRAEFPMDWKVTPEGFIWPGNYVDYTTVDNLYRTSKSFTFFMGQSKEEEINRSLGLHNTISLPDMELRAKAIEHSVKMFNTTSLRGLSIPERLSLAKELRKTYRCSPKQIGRIVHLNQVYIKEFL